MHRAARELLLNVVKHAKTDQAWLALARRDHAIELSVEDRGAGFDPATTRVKGASFGLRSLRERCELLGGQMQIESRPGDGTRGIVILPAGE